MINLFRVATLAMFLGASVVQAYTPPRMKTISCNDYKFTERVWHDLTAQEPRLRDHLVGIQRQAPGPDPKIVKMRHCRVSVPVNDRGEEIAGERIAYMDKTWDVKYTDGRVDTYHSGLKIIYNESTSSLRTYKQTDNVLTVIGYDACGIPIVTSSGSGNWVSVPSSTRKVYGFTVCGGGISCEELGIPLYDTPTSGEEVPELIFGAR